MNEVTEFIFLHSVINFPLMSIVPATVGAGVALWPRTRPFAALVAFAIFLFPVLLLYLEDYLTAPDDSPPFTPGYVPLFAHSLTAAIFAFIFRFLANRKKKTHSTL